MIRTNWLLIPALVAALALGGCTRDDAAAAPGPVANAAPGADEHDHGADAPDDGHDHPAVEPATADPVVDAVEHIELTAEQRRRIDLQLAVAGPGSVDVETSFPGEIVLNPDRMAHVVPRTPGIVREVHRTLGDHVEAGEILAWIESDRLAEAKLDFYAKQAELGCCMVELPRAEEIFENTNRLLALLATEPDPEDLRTLDGREMGEHRGRLITAYVEYFAARKTHQRERELHTKNISSEKELVEAEAAFETAQAQLAAARDIARYKVQIAYGEAARLRQVASTRSPPCSRRSGRRPAWGGMRCGRRSRATSSRST
jgi:multidrug efflux pump subunit AcrA (membrane-fusion protein)